MRKMTLGLALSAAVVLLAGCESSEQKAERHFRAGAELAEAGDVSRALIELRNVFRYAPMHEEARATYARLVYERGDRREAYSQYLRLVEQHPDNLEGRRALAEMALDQGNWDEVQRHAAAATALAPDDTLIRSINLALAYRDALMQRDNEARTRVLAEARAMVEAHPDQIIVRRALIDGLVRDENWEGALAEVDAALAASPEAHDLPQMRAAALYQLGRLDELETQLLAMIEADPANQAYQNSLISLYLTQERPEAAEGFLRSRVDLVPGDIDRVTRLAGFVAQSRGREAARDELSRIIATDPPKLASHRALRAALDFEMGNHDAAIAEMRAIIASAPEAEILAEIRVGLARMLAATNNEVGARALVEEVLAADSGNVGALKLKANQLIDDDRTGDALVALRSALERAPRDPEALTLMARAYERDGSRDLMGEMLSLAVDAANRAPAESLRYAAFLERDGKFLPAEDVLTNALRLQPQNVDLLASLGRVYIAMKDWPRAEHVARTLTGIGGERAVALANEITAQRLARQNQDEELEGFLRGLSAEGGVASTAAEVALIRSSLLKGDADEALRQAQTLLSRNPGNPALRYLHASVLLSMGRIAEGEAEIRAITAERPDYEPAWVRLHNLALSRGDREEAIRILDQGIAALPEGASLQWARAGVLEQAGDIAGAIGIYEALYERDSNSVIIANNLASLLSMHRDDPESLERAYTVARRLRGVQMPAFQDTYGWIAWRRGNYDEALAHLEPAARGLPQDRTVQYHLAMTYAALDRQPEALEILKRIVAEADAANPPAWLAAARDEIARLEAPTTGAAGGTTGN